MFFKVRIFWKISRNWLNCWNLWSIFREKKNIIFLLYLWMNCKTSNNTFLNPRKSERELELWKSTEAGLQKEFSDLLLEGLKFVELGKDWSKERIPNIVSYMTRKSMISLRENLNSEYGIAYINNSLTPMISLLILTCRKSSTLK